MEKMINRWLSAGVINKETANVLLTDVKREKDKQNKLRKKILICTIFATFIITIISCFFEHILLILLLCLSVIYDIFKTIIINTPSILISLLTILTISSLIGGYNLAFEKKKFPQLGHSLIILSSLLIGGTYALIGQTYNIDANNTGLMFLWLISILPLAYILKNNIINIISIILFYIGSKLLSWNFNDDNTFYFFIYWLPLIGIGFYTIGNIPIIKKEFNKFSITYKILGLISIFIPLSVLTMQFLALVLPNANEIIVMILANIAIITIILISYILSIKNKKQNNFTLTVFLLQQIKKLFFKKEE